MPLTKNWEAIAFSGATSYEIKISAEVTHSSSAAVPHLRRRTQQRYEHNILQLDLVNAGTPYLENFRQVTYYEKIEEISTYMHVEIFLNNDKIEGIPVQIIGS